MNGHQRRPVFFISDGTGITAETLGNSVLTQFDGSFSKTRRPFIEKRAGAKAVVAEIRTQAQRGVEPIVFLTIMSSEIREVFNDCPGIVLDLVEPSLVVLEERLGQKASRSLGKAHGIADSDVYRNRMAAVEFALEHDDGQSIKALGLPTSFWWGHHGWGRPPPGCIWLSITVFALQITPYWMRILLPKDSRPLWRPSRTNSSGWSLPHGICTKSGPSADPTPLMRQCRNAFLKRKPQPHFFEPHRSHILTPPRSRLKKLRQSFAPLCVSIPAVDYTGQPQRTAPCSR
jgi:hypothetical protein